ncbi:MAG: metal ABC transporter substrate-binding protein [Eubacterium sp.]
MKKIFCALTAVIIMITAFTGCTSNESSAEKTDNTQKISIIATIFPEYDWVRQIAKNTDNIQLTLMLDNGVDLHNFQPTADDIINISDCDMFIYTGGESDKWVDDALKQAKNESVKSINLMEILKDSVKTEETKEGMQEAEDDEHEQEEEEEYDEHVWLSLRNAVTACNEIADALCEIDPDNAQTYNDNFTAYKKELESLDAQYTEAVNNASKKTILFADRFPFRYLAEDYSLDYYAAFSGCSAETEASFETVKFLASKVDELGLTAVLTIENPQHQIARTVVENTKDKNQQILSMDSMQSTTSKDAENGKTYLGIMQSNLDVLIQALA